VRQVRRRTWPTVDRLRIVRETLEPGVVVQAVADRHGISTGLSVVECFETVGAAG